MGKQSIFICWYFKNQNIAFQRYKNKTVLSWSTTNTFKSNTFNQR